MADEFGDVSLSTTLEEDGYIAYVTTIAKTNGISASAEVILEVSRAIRKQSIASDPSSVARTLRLESSLRTSRMTSASGASGKRLRWFMLICLALIVVLGVPYELGMGPHPLFQWSPKVEDLQRSVVLVEVLDINNQRVGLGSGIVIDKDQILTNIHVITGGAVVRVTQSGVPSREIDGILMYDSTNDLVVISATTTIEPAKLGSSTRLRVGERVTAVGNPLGLTGSVSEGIISGFRDIEGKRLIQMTAPISPGSSGGALFNSKGELIAVTVARLQEGQNINLAVPIDLAKDLIQPTSQVVPYGESDFSRVYPSDREIDGLVGPVAKMIERDIGGAGEWSRTTEYDSGGQRLKQVESSTLGTTTTTFEHDRYKRSILAIGSGGLGESRKVYSYDTEGHLIERRWPDGSAVRYEYDGEGRLKVVTSQFGNLRNVDSYTYAADGHLEEKVMRFGSLISKSGYSEYRFDAHGNWIERTVRTYDLGANGSRVTSEPITLIHEYRELIYRSV